MSGDNKVVYLGLQNEREWKKFCEVVLQNPAAILRILVLIPMPSEFRIVRSSIKPCKKFFRS